MLALIAAALAAGTPLVNSAAETVLGSHAIPAHWWQPGKVLKFEALVRTVDNNSTDTLVIRVRVGAGTLTGTAIVQTGAVDQVDGDVCVVTGTIVCRSFTDATDAELVATAASNNPDAPGQGAEHHGGVLTSVDLTQAMLLEVTGQWSVAHVDNECQLEALNVYEGIA